MWRGLVFRTGTSPPHQVIQTINAAADATGRRVTIMADLSGTRIRVANLDPEKIELKAEAIPGGLALLTEGPFHTFPDSNYCLEIIEP